MYRENWKPQKCPSPDDIFMTPHPTPMTDNMPMNDLKDYFSIIHLLVDKAVLSFVIEVVEVAEEEEEELMEE